MDPSLNGLYPDNFGKAREIHGITVINLPNSFTNSWKSLVLRPAFKFLYCSGRLNLSPVNVCKKQLLNEGIRIFGNRHRPFFMNFWNFRRHKFENLCSAPDFHLFMLIFRSLLNHIDQTLNFTSNFFFIVEVSPSKSKVAKMSQCEAPLVPPEHSTCEENAWNGYGEAIKINWMLFNLTKIQKNYLILTFSESITSQIQFGIS